MPDDIVPPESPAAEVKVAEPPKEEPAKKAKEPDTADTAFRGVDARLKAVEAKLEVKKEDPKKGLFASLEGWLERDL